jgi:Zn-finger protein
MNNTRISEHKKTFFAELERQPRLVSSYQLAVNELPAIIRYYQDKFNIRIYLNGTFFISNQVKQTLQTEKDRLQTELTPYGGDRKYLCYFQKFWVSPGFFHNKLPKHLQISSDYPADFSKEYEFIYKNIKDFLLDQKDEIKSGDISDEDVEKLNKFIAANLKLQEKINQKISLYLIECEKKRNNLWIDSDACVNEIKAIQAALQEGEMVGYIFSQGYIAKPVHCEFFVIEKKVIIRPISWLTYLEDDLYGKLVSQNAAIYAVPVDSEYPTCPQTNKDIFSCATLGILYLKELLKDKAKQYRELSFYFSHRSGSQCKKIFVPSPQSLRYSQSSYFNEALAAAMQDTLDCVVVANRDHSVTTFKKLLTDSIQDIHLSDEIKERNKLILKDYSAFSQRWLQEYQKSAEKRNLMQLFYMNESLNRYLTYQSHRMHLIAMLPNIKKEDVSWYEKFVKGGHSNNANIPRKFGSCHSIHTLFSIYQKKQSVDSSQNKARPRIKI